ncbi:MAG: PfkB family carbohydrate kinase, partial [Candidatus Marinimicrobia bacterium]|nr:PfkB family carbohydrate kinase [Candidatus Neomarinimicrobiota bacterium]
MTSNHSHQALVFGSISIDKIINRYGIYDNVLGGSASYALLATKSKECQLVGMVGSDFPKNHFNLLGNHSINLDDLKIEEGKTFSWGGEYAHDFSSRETLYVDPGVSEKFEPILSKHSRQCEYLLLGNTHPKLQLEVLNQIESNPFVILDTFKLYMDIANSDLKKIISKSNLLCINYNEAVHLSGLKNHNLNEIAEYILSLGSDSLIIKQGEDGATFFDGNSSFSINAYPVNKVMDTTGAGDTFAGGILSSKIAGKNMEESMI